MTEEDFEDVMTIVDAVLDRFLSGELREYIVDEIKSGVAENWNTLKDLRKRKEGQC